MSPGTADVASEYPGDMPTPRKAFAIPWELQRGGMMWMKRAMDALAEAHEPILQNIQRIPVAELPEEVQGESAPADTSASAELSLEGQVAGTANSAVAPTSLYRSIAVQHEWLAKVDTVLNFDVNDFLADLDDLARAFASQMASAMLAHISEVADAAGQTVDSSGKDMWEALLEAMEKVELSFDEEGQHHGTVVVHPNMAKKMMANPPTPEQETRAQAIIQRKREEWNASRQLEDLPQQPD